MCETLCYQWYYFRYYPAIDKETLTILMTWYYWENSCELHEFPDNVWGNLQEAADLTLRTIGLRMP